ncbi:tripartite tricarboxylate transporter TctB family protein [Puniceibacterium sp. IMCC21224]|uniref:tripartite tricarboxylate transporter TctB family protein n=1 Tax=Puniceibacterium sp. IMCC21224 TaxID=1618204 RepID=UPI00064DBAB4|nr:tripartite tricarboxylate transporter TctB family protein [Puniceibacterium sp. IMCC21224]KMK68944.1 Tripartite tricarboxylate transporter TctB family [Puniceibacterium sp. IMCC21224]
MFMNKHLLFLYVTLAVSVGYFISAMSLGDPFSAGGLTPSFFPLLVGAAAILFASTLIVQKLREAPAEQTEDGPSTYTHLWVTVAMFVYISVFRTAGYFISSWLFVFVLILLFSAFEKFVQKAVISAVIVGLAYLMFQLLFGVRLPTIWG